MAKKSFKTAVVLGSGEVKTKPILLDLSIWIPNELFEGGHTGEMFKLLQGLDLAKYTPLEFIVADTDAMSIEKVRQFVEPRQSTQDLKYEVHKINRSRRVGQSYLTSIFTTLLAVLYSIPLVFKLRADLLLLNGPGTCVPICVMLFFFSRVLCLLPRARIVFVESICRVKSLSLTGKIFYYLRLTDDFIVQWPELRDKYPRAIYLDRLV